MLEIKNLHARVAEREILKGINLQVPAGEVHAIMGPNGSGKSTLSYVLSGRDGYEVTGGSATLDGADLLARATGCGATLFAPGQVPLPPDLAGPLGMGTWFVLHEEDRQFGIVDVQGDRVRWVVLTALTTRKYEDGSIGVGATTPLVDLGHYLAHFRCEAPQ